MPGAIALAGAGFVITALAGAFDGIWHTAFGLDETGWSVPHSMLGSGIFVAFVGITACRWALRDRKPIGWGSAIVFGFLLIATAGERFTGPIGTNLSPGYIEFVARIPVLANEPAFQHTARIYLASDLHRGSPLFVPLESASAGMALALLRRFDPRPVLVIGLTLLASRTSEYIPFVVPGIVMGLRGTRQAPTMTWAIAGGGFAVATAIVWRGAPGGVLAGTVAFVAGVWIGHRLWDVVDRPLRRGVLAVAAIFGLAYPALTGAVDLALRARVP